MKAKKIRGFHNESLVFGSELAAATAVVRFTAATVTAAAAEKNDEDKYNPKTGVTSKTIVTAHKKLHSAAVHRLFINYNII